MAVPMWMQRKVRDVMLDFSYTKGYMALQEIQDKYPVEARKIIFTKSKKGSNQYSAKGRVYLEIPDKAFDRIENGGDFIPFSGVFTQNVSAHDRTSGKPKTRIRKILSTVMRKKAKSTRVKAHKRTYTNMKPVKLANGEWRILKGTPATKGKQPLTKAINKAMNNEYQIAEWIKQFLK